MLHDKATIHVEGGRGGNGCVSFRREAHVPRGGPDGGDGGPGGDVVAVCDPSKRDLAATRGRRQFKAKKGGNGEGSGRHGARGEDLVIPVAPGTQAGAVDGSVYDLVDPGQRAVLAHGGRGGKGNKRFASSTRQAPRFAERGDPGESGWIELTLKLLADVGLVGLPNAGKSSLLSRLTRAAPKIGDYPFTTLEPVLGTMDAGDRQVVIADIPGLIEGAAEGAGLGHEFLAHVERCALLVHLVDVMPMEGDSESAYRTVRAELARHGAGLEELPEVIMLSKADLLTDEQRTEARERWQAATGHEVVLASSATGEGLDDLRRLIAGKTPEEALGAARGEASVAMEGEARPEAIATHRIYRPAGEEGYSVEREDHAFRIHGHGVELLFERHDLTNEEALGYLEQRLNEMGVVAALRRAGFEPGDELRVGDFELEFHPGG